MCAWEQKTIFSSLVDKFFSFEMGNSTFKVEDFSTFLQDLNVRQIMYSVGCKGGKTQTMCWRFSPADSTGHKGFRTEHLFGFRGAFVPAMPAPTHGVRGIHQVTLFLH